MRRVLLACVVLLAQHASVVLAQDAAQSGDALLQRLRDDPARAVEVLVEAKSLPPGDRRKLIERGGGAISVSSVAAAFARLEELREASADRWCLEIIHQLPPGHPARMQGPAFVAPLWRENAPTRLIQDLSSKQKPEEAELLGTLLSTLVYRNKSTALSAQLWRLAKQARAGSYIRALALRALVRDGAKDTPRKAAQEYLAEDDALVRSALLGLIDPAADPKLFTAVRRRYEAILGPVSLETRAFLRLAVAARTDQGLDALRNAAIYSRGAAERTVALQLLKVYAEHPRFLDVVKEVRDLQVNEPEARASLQIALLQLLSASKEPRALELFEPALRDPDPAVRVAAVYELRGFSGDRTLSLYRSLLHDKAPRVILGAIWGLAATKRAEALDCLIGELDGLSRAGDVVYLDALRALKVLTGLDLGSGPEAAAKWRQLTPAPPILPVRSARGAGKTIVKSFFDHRIYSLHPLFIVDVSRSMDTSTGFLTRREVLFRELEGALGSLEEAARFHVIAFDGELHPWPEGPREAVEDSIAGAGRFLRSLPRGKGTNYYVALRAALDAKEFDTAYFLSDGEPTAGEIRESGPLARWFKEANLERGLVVNTVGIGDNGGILRMIAVQSGGAYRPMREDTIDG